MKKGLVLVFLAVLCAACYGGPVINYPVLVYKFTASFNTWIDYTDSDKDTTNWVSKMTVNGYLILEVRDVNAMSLNSSDALVMIAYGKDANNLWGVGLDKWYWADSTTIGGNFNATMLDYNDVTSMGSSAFASGDLHEDNNKLTTWLYGKTAKNVVIGPLTKATIVKSFKGTITSDNSNLTTLNGYNDASGDLTLTLDMANTKYANTLTVDQVNIIRNKIIADLEKKGFQSLP